MLNVPEWNLILQKTNTSSPLVSSFQQPVTLQVGYDPDAIVHLDENNLALQRFDTTSNLWIALPTTIDKTLHQVTAQTLEVGNFDFQAPLICPADISEPDDGYSSSRAIPEDGSSISDLFDTQQDEDWFNLNASAGWKYTVQTSNLAAGVDTKIEIYDQDGVTVLASDDNSGGGLASKLVWHAPTNGIYFIRVFQGVGSTFGCNATYDLSVKGESQLYLPVITR